jgi:antitoxin MazE
MNKFTRSIQSKIVRIGNSQGIRIPHALLQQLHLTKDVEMSVRDDQLIIRAARAPRAGWEDRFARAASAPAAPGLAPVETAAEAADISTEWDGAGLAW